MNRSLKIERSKVKKEKKWFFSTEFSELLDLDWCHIFAALVTVGRVAWNWGVAVRACFQSELFRPDVLVHHLGKLGVTQKSASWLTG
jgi:hypothetical protein